MAIGSGLAGSVGTGEESTYGTPVTVDRWVEPNGDVDVALTKEFYDGGGVAAGRLGLPASMRVEVGRSVGGTIPLEVRQSKAGRWFRQAFGSTPTPTQQNTSTGYLQAHTYADTIGKSQTIQVGVPDTSGTVRAFTYNGAKVNSLEFSCAVGQPLTMSVGIIGRDVTTATALAAPVYTTGQRPFHWAHFTAKTGTYGSESAVQGIRGFTWRIERPMSLRQNSGLAGLTAEPINDDHPQVTGTIEVEFGNLTDWTNLFLNNTNTALALVFEDTTVSLGGSPTIYPKLSLKIASIALGEGTPSLSGPGVQTRSFPFTAKLDASGNPLCALDYISTDTAL